MVKYLDQLHSEYWQRFRELQFQEAPELPLGREENRYFVYSFGVSGTHIAAAFLAQARKVRLNLLLQGEHREERFRELFKAKDKIEAELGERAIWTPGKKTPNRAWVTVEISIDDPYDKSDWPRQQMWILHRVSKFYKAFGQRLHDLKGTP